MPADVRVSVIVPFHNSARHFAELLQSIACQELSEPFEVVAVDNHSRDQSRAIVQRFATSMSIRLVDAPRIANGSYARNVGARHAVGTALVFADSDDALAPGYLQAMVDALTSSGFATSRVECRSLNPGWVRRAHSCWHEQGLEVVYGFLPSTGGNVAVRRDVFESVGGYPEDFDACQDTVFAWRVQLAGTPLTFAGDALYRYRYRDSLRALFSQCRNWGRADAQLFSTFRGYGMPARSLSQSARDWRAVVSAFFLARSRGDLAGLMTRLGYCVGRLTGSIRFRVRYF